MSFAALTDHELTLKSAHCRRTLLRALQHAGAGHTARCLAGLDILNVLYHRVLRISPRMFASPQRDRYVHGRGQPVEALLVVLADCGFFPGSEFEMLCHAHVTGHPLRNVPGVEQDTGAPGPGLPSCVGMAIAGKKGTANFRVFTLLGEGELAEGPNREAALAAAHDRLDNLTTIIDCSVLPISGRTRDARNHEPLEEKFAAFGWAVRRVDGHDLGALTGALEKPLEPGKPSAVIAQTSNGHGVSSTEDFAAWHHGLPNEDEYARALARLDAVIWDLEGAGGHSK